MGEEENLKKVFDRDEIVLKGRKYNGRFIGEQKQGRAEAGSEYTPHWDYRYYWKGKGVIEHRATNKKQRFLFTTFDSQRGREWMGDSNQHGLEESLICFEGDFKRVEIRKENINDYTALIDSALEKMYLYSKSKVDEEIIPIVRPIPFRVCSLKFNEQRISL